MGPIELQCKILYPSWLPWMLWMLAETAIPPQTEGETLRVVTRTQQLPPQVQALMTMAIDHQSAAEVEEWIDPFDVHKEKLSNPQRAAYGGMGAYRPVRNRNKKSRK